jgi:hypothetical protein
MAFDTRKALISVGVGIADVLIFQHFVPSVTDIRVADKFNKDIEHAELEALAVGTAFTVLVSIMTGGLEPFIVGGAILVGLDFASKHANAVDPNTGKMASQEATESTSYPMPDYQG